MWNPERKLDLPQNTTQCHGVWLCRLENSAYRWCTLARAVSLSFLFFFLALSLFSWSSACLSRKKLELISQYAGALEYLYMPLQHTATYYTQCNTLHYKCITTDHTQFLPWTQFDKLLVWQNVGFFFKCWPGFIVSEKVSSYSSKPWRILKKMSNDCPGPVTLMTQQPDRNDRRYKIWQNK